GRGHAAGRYEREADVSGDPEEEVRQPPGAPAHQLEGAADLHEPALPRQPHVRDAARRAWAARAAQLGRDEGAPEARVAPVALHPMEITPSHHITNTTP